MHLPTVIWRKLVYAVLSFLVPFYQNTNSLSHRLLAILDPGMTMRPILDPGMGVEVVYVIQVRAVSSRPILFSLSYLWLDVEDTKGQRDVKTTSSQDHHTLLCVKQLMFYYHGY